MTASIIALGANLPGRFASPAMAVEAGLSALEGADVRLLARSRLYRSPAWPNPSEPEFVNAAALFDTTLSAAALINRLHAIETEFGRTRVRPNAPRPLDLDIVDYGGTVSAPGEIPVLPHPRIADRAFVLLPMAEIAPDWRHPVNGRSLLELIAALPDSFSTTPL